MKSATFISIFMLLSACAPSETAIQTAVAQTQMALPTSTVAPTSTVIPTATINPTSTPDNQAYLSALKSNAGAWLSAYSDFEALFQELRADTSLLLDANWKSRLDSAMDTLIVAANKLESITPVPPDFETTNGYLIQLASETRLLVLSFKLFLSGDTSQVDAINEHNGNLSEFMQLVTDEIEKHTP